jgi:hypothetical protein
MARPFRDFDQLQLARDLDVNRQLKRWMLGLVLVIAGVAGCGGPESLSGSVTLDGKPLAGAAVVFFPEQSDAETVVGATDENGRFVITPAAGDSIAYGKYKVIVTKREDLTPAQIDAFVTPKELLPPKYSDLSKTELSAEVTSSADVDLHLTH